MLICHFSDWHTRFRDLPVADLYICTGDMLADFWTMGNKTPRVYMEEKQREWVADLGDCRRFLGNPDAPVLCVNGNHDFVDISPLWPGSYQIKNVETLHTLPNGVTYSGWEGVPPIDGTWAWEMNENTIKLALPDVSPDIMISHSPPHDMLDCSPNGPGRRHFGSKSYKTWLLEHPIKLACFGHIHYSRDVLTTPYTIYSNAATIYNMIELDI